MNHTKTMLKIISLFGIVILMSFIPENFRDFFGDWYCENSDNLCKYDASAHHAATWHWGFRHYIWCLMGLTLFIYNVVLMIPKDKRL